jgi:tRNA A-37 threonylcarbamoyl transferase component Bud32
VRAGCAVSRVAEEPVLAGRARDVAVTAVVLALTAVVFAAVADHGVLAHIQRRWSAHRPDRSARLWAEVGKLHRAGIAHRSLRAANVMVAPVGPPAIVDFGFSELAATQRQQDLDVAELLSWRLLRRMDYI